MSVPLPSSDPAPAHPRVDVHGVSHTGLVRQTNEDHFLIAALQKSVEVLHTNLALDALSGQFEHAEGYLLVVADGVGGRSGGAAASGIAVRTTLEFIARATGCYQRFDVEEEHEFIGAMEGAIREAHDLIHAEFGGPDRSPATTLTMVMLALPRAYIVHVGDTRAYYLRAGRLFQLTRDQTYGQYMLDVGALSEDQIARSPAARTLASAIGSADLSPSIGLIDLEPGDTLLVCSDGLTRHLADDEIAGVLADAAGARAGCDELVRRALEKGGRDNVTVVVARWPVSPES